MQISFELPGPPKPKGRPRVTSRGTYTPKATQDYEKAIANVALVALHTALRADEDLKWDMEGRYRLVCEFRHKKSLGSCPDGDNCLKAVSDGLEGILYRNDRLVVEGVFLTVPDCDNPSTHVTVRVL